MSIVPRRLASRAFHYHPYAYLWNYRPEWSSARSENEDTCLLVDEKDSTNTPRVAPKAFGFIVIDELECLPEHKSTFFCGLDQGFHLHTQQQRVCHLPGGS